MYRPIYEHSSGHCEQHQGFKISLVHRQSSHPRLQIQTNWTEPSLNWLQESPRLRAMDMDLWMPGVIQSHEDTKDFPQELMELWKTTKETQNSSHKWPSSVAYTMVMHCLYCCSASAWIPPDTHNDWIWIQIQICKYYQSSPLLTLSCMLRVNKTSTCCSTWHGSTVILGYHSDWRNVARW